LGSGVETVGQIAEERPQFGGGLARYARVEPRKTIQEFFEDLHAGV
jgi:hypothetical protein